MTTPQLTQALRDAAEQYPNGSMRINTSDVKQLLDDLAVLRGALEKIARLTDEPGDMGLRRGSISMIARAALTHNTEATQ